MELITTSYKEGKKVVFVKEYEAVTDIRGVENNVVNLFFAWTENS